MARPDDFLRHGDPAERRDELRRYIGPNADSFLPVYDRMQAKQSSALPWTGFCWPAFFLGPVWFFYRKLWLFAGLLCAIILAVALIPKLPPISGLIVSFISARMARWLYLTDAMKRLEALRETGQINRPGAIERAGGVSKPAAWISGIIFGLLYAVTLGLVVYAISEGYPPPQ
ncbi:DUF2628 domain-containing protein [Acetobacteraceae bacterium KSS8]|uniref:DUF2628 domain-containing protein n=1 Tax=Endosaccharibacter trunci TaxID=2812733 RepID=A0ABT1WAG6_9PROT|nr:DUF2628 domain-containing protein [Acetobacteraceae bacterium KSS8]